MVYGMLEDVMWGLAMWSSKSKNQNLKMGGVGLMMCVNSLKGGKDPFGLNK